MPHDHSLRPTPARAYPATRWTRRDTLLAAGASLALTVATGPQTMAAGAQSATPEPAAAQPFPPERQLALTEIVLSSLAETNTPGALVGLWYPGQGAWTMAAGIGDLATAVPMRLDDHIRIASITKTFVAVVVLQLVDEGLLSLEDHLEQFISGIPNGQEITLRQLLNMTAGIYDYVLDPLIVTGFVEDPRVAFTPDQAVEIVRVHGEADFPPGERVQYSNTNYVLLGLIIEQVTGRTAAEEITDRIITPLGLTQTSFPATPDMPEPFAHGYLAEAPGDPLRDVTSSNPEIAWTSGAIISTLGDLRIWADALASGALIRPELRAEQQTFGWIRQEPVRIGYGLGLLSLNGLLGHNGGILGYSSWMVKDPETGLTLVIVTNRGTNESGSAEPIFIRILSLLLPDRFAAPPASPATPEASPAA